MLDITIISLGKMKESYWQEAAAEYIKRLRPYIRLKEVELAPASFSKDTKEKAKEVESRRIMDFLNKSGSGKEQPAVYLLAERGREYDSPALAAWLENNSPLILIIGGALGFSAELYRRYPQISLSPLTFPHELARVVVLEQLYRAASILNKKEYHY